MTPADSRAIMLRELDEQPGILATLANPMRELAKEIQLDKDRPVWIGGCGDGLFAAQAMALHFRRHGWDMRPVSAAEMLWDADIRPEDTVVGISMSGSTRRTVEALTAAAERGARTVAVTLNATSALGQVAAKVLPLPFVPISRAIPHGLDYHVTLLALAALAGPAEGAMIEQMFHMETALTLSRARDVSTGLSENARFFFLGGGSALGTANFGAAKLHEAGGIPACAFEAENFAHGAQFMLRSGDHVVLCGAGGPADLRTAALRDGVARLGVSVSAAGPLNTGASQSNTLLAAMQAALAAQCLCLAVAEVRDLNVTDPGQETFAADVQRDWFGWRAT